MCNIYSGESDDFSKQEFYPTGRKGSKVKKWRGIVQSFRLFLILGDSVSHYVQKRMEIFLGPPFIVNIFIKPLFIICISI